MLERTWEGIAMTTSVGAALAELARHEFKECNVVISILATRDAEAR